ncbi:hypothetical protein [Glycomyces tarimensis]
MRHNRVLQRQRHRHAFRNAFAGAALATGAAAALGYLIALSTLAGWAALGIAAAVALVMRIGSSQTRGAIPPVAGFPRPRR